MKNFVVYKSNTGQILRSGLCADADVLLQVQNEQEELLVDVTADVKLYYVDNGSVVLLPPRPGDSFVFDYSTKQWVDTRTNETQWAVVRADRNQRLQATDWTQLADIPAQTKSLWEPYRQELRDVTSQSDPFNIVWPTPPQ